MRISIFTTVTEPIRRQDPFKEAIRSYKDIADEIIIINGGEEYLLEENCIEIKSKWDFSFNFEHIGKQFQKGYEACTGDWAIKMDLDTFIHENDIEALKHALDTHSDHPAVSFVKMNWVKEDLFIPKARTIFAVNKKLCGDRLKWDASITKSKPSLDGKEIEIKTIPDSIAVYNYHFATKDKEQITEDRYRFAKAWERMTGSKEWGSQSPVAAYEHFKNECIDRASKYTPTKINHPKYITNYLKRLPKNRLYNWVEEYYQ